MLVFAEGLLFSVSKVHVVKYSAQLGFRPDVYFLKLSRSGGHPYEKLISPPDDNLLILFL